MGRENTCYAIFYVGASRIAYSVHTLLKWLLHSFFSFDLFTFFPVWRDARTIHIYVNLLDLIKEEKKDEICCIISHQNALEVNSCRILLWHTTNKLQLIHSIPFLYRVQKNVPHFSLRRGNRDHLVCLSTNFIPSNDLKGMKKCMKNVS